MDIKAKISECVGKNINGYIGHHVIVDHRNRNVLIGKHICGKEKKFRTVSSFMNNSQHCIRCEQATRVPMKILFDIYVNSANKRNIEFCLHIEEFSWIVSQDCFYCGKKPEKKIKGTFVNSTWFDDLLYNGIDRMNSHLGYKVGNVLPCCTSCNKSKGNMKFDDWIEMLQAISRKLYFVK